MRRILSIGYGKNLFIEGDVERLRIERYANKIDSLHMIVFSRSSDGLVYTKVNEKLTLHPTNSLFIYFAPLKALIIGLKVLKEKDGWTVTSQDPFETAFVGVLLKMIKKVPLVIQEHGDFFSANYWREESLLNKIRFSIGKRLIKRADRVRVVSVRIKETMLGLGIGEQDIRIHPLRTDVLSIQSSEVKDDAREIVRDGDFLVLSIGRFVKQKNLTMLIRSFSNLTKVNKNARLLLVGSGPEESVCKKLVDELGLNKEVTFLPWTNDPISLMKTSDMYAHTSNYDGWARVLVEAMASGLTVVTTNVGCAGDVLLDQKHGFVVETNDISSFTDAIVELNNDKQLRSTLSENAVRDAREIFSGEKTHEKEWIEIHSIQKA